MRRVVVTGLGIVSPLGVGIKSNWDNLVAMKSGVRKISKFNTDLLYDGASKVAGEVNEDVENNGYNVEEHINKKDLKKSDKFIWYGIGAVDQAISDAGFLSGSSDEEKERIGVIMTSGIGGLLTVQNTSLNSVLTGAIKKTSPFFIPATLINSLSGLVSIKYDFRGLNYSIVSACASSNHAIGESFEIIKRDDADVMVCGGAESAICEIGISGFCSMKALSSNFNDTPEKASRPWDKNRDGFVMGEGSGALVLEEYEHAKKRNAKIYAEVVSYSASADAYHITAPHSDGRGAKQAMKLALKKAKLNEDQIDYINAHGTSTPVGDAIEFNAVKEVFSNTLNKISMSSTKSSTGHLLGAAGAIEAIYCIKALNESLMPATLNLDEQDENCRGIDLLANKVKEKQLNYVLSNSFGFGGTNSCLIFGKIK